MADKYAGPPQLVVADAVSSAYEPFDFAVWDGLDVARLREDGRRRPGRSTPRCIASMSFCRSWCCRLSGLAGSRTMFRSSMLRGSRLFADFMTILAA